MSDTKEKEITIKEITLPTERATITYRKTNLDGYGKGIDEYLEVKDTSSSEAFKTFKKVRKEVKEDKEK